MIILKSSITLIALFLLSGNIDARGGGRGGGRSGSRGRGGMHHGGGGLGWAFSSYFTNSQYGDSFGSKGLPENSYISKDDYKYKESSGFLISSLFNGRWNQEKDRKWRESTRAPYFENKIPGNQEKIPASAIVGAAKAFGLVSLLPLNVPPGKPLMYCGNTDLIQSQIRINKEATYVCNNAKIEISCKKSFENQLDHGCKNEVMQCDLQYGVAGAIYCSQDTLFSKNHIFCDTTATVDRKDLNETMTIVNCYKGQLPKSQASFVPTTTSTTEHSYFNIFTTTPKPLSFKANLHVFLINLIGKSDALETTTPDVYPFTGRNAWHPEALTIPPETTTTTPRPTTTKLPYVWMEKVYTYHDNGTVEITIRPVPKHLLPFPFETDPFIPYDWFKVYTTSTKAYEETTTELKTTTTTEEPYVWMMKVPSDDSNEKERLEPAHSEIVDLIENYGSCIPENFVKVPRSKAYKFS
ncbi:unnamed protein product [Chironomus riparius]|uniref:Uncharacterized protein n=1 Tax=Chironomus riparius TaxID=315576 RepID=A0A9N9RHK3_9DIPT|nr:unnamed protein product [Chironomus riparius]